MTFPSRMTYSSNKTIQGWVEVKCFGLTLAVSGLYTPAVEGTPCEFLMDKIEYKGEDISIYCEAFNVQDEIVELAEIEAVSNLIIL